MLYMASNTIYAQTDKDPMCPSHGTHMYTTCHIGQYLAHVVIKSNYRTPFVIWGNYYNIGQ